MASGPDQLETGPIVFVILLDSKREISTRASQSVLHLMPHPTFAVVLYDPV